MNDWLVKVSLYSRNLDRSAPGTSRQTRGHIACSLGREGSSLIRELSRASRKGMTMKHRVLIADDDESGRGGLAALLGIWGYEVQEAVDGKDALERAPGFRPHVVIADMIMPVIDGIGLLKPLAATVPEAAVILLTAHGSIETAVSAMREGAYDYMTKPVDPRRLRVLVEKAVEKVQVNREVTVLRRQLKETRGLGPLLGVSPGMQE